MGGHFEVYPVMADVGGTHTGGQDPAKAERLEGPVGYAWRFVGEDGRIASSTETYNSPEAAKAAVGEFVLAVRAATYGQRFAGTIAEAVIDTVG